MNLLPVPEPVGLWEFGNASDLVEATLGTELSMTVEGTSPTHSETLEDDTTAIAEGVITTVGGGGNHLKLAHGISANGGGSAVNEYTLLFDVFSPAASRGSWRCFFQVSPGNGDDGEYFIRNNNNTMGTADLGYTSAGLDEASWKRVVIVADLTSFRTYVDGELFHVHSDQSVDGRYALESEILLFADNNGENAAMNVSTFAMWGEALSENEVAGLGVVDSAILGAMVPEPNEAPVIAEGEIVSLAARMSVREDITLHASDVNAGDIIRWSISDGPENGVALVTEDANEQAVISYTSNAFTGEDQFVVTASDGEDSDSIVIHVAVGNTAPTITEGDHCALNAAMNPSEAPMVTFHATDADEGQVLDWSVDVQGSNGIASVDSQADGAAVIQYLPNTDFSGIDHFVIRVTDGFLSDSISVSVSVIDPNADPKLTIESTHGLATPAAGEHFYAVGTEVTVSVTGESTDDARYTPIGWTAVGSAPVEGAGTSASFEMTRDTVLTWQFRTEYLVDVESTVGGSVDLTDGWYDAAMPLTITATPQAGYYFSGWTGDTSGALIGGNTIILPMDRAHDTVTANFTSEEIFSVIALPDTQNYCNNDTRALIYKSQTDWIVDNLETENIKFVTHLGDIVNNQYSDAHWLRANTAMDVLNHRIPFGTCPGNHDYSEKYITHYGPEAARWVDPSDGQVYDWYQGSSPRGWSDYQVVHINGRDWMFLHLNIDAWDSEIIWAQAVLDAHPTTLTVLTTHNYLAESGGGGKSGTGTGEGGRPKVLWMSDPDGDRNTPEEVFQKLVFPNNQIYMVICGHAFAIYNLEETNEAGNVVHEVLVDYQTLPNGGNGFLRQMEYRPSEGKVVHSTYSPYLGRDWDPNISADSQGMYDLHDRWGGSFFEMEVDFDGRFDQTLTVVSPQESVTPAVGTHEIAEATPFVINAEDVVDGRVREKVVGWTLVGENQNTSGNGKVATLTMDGAATLTWTYETQYQLTTQALGDGIVSIPSGWQNVDAPVSIQAQPDVGANFVGWLGDTEGATISGTTISFTMDRPRGPVTAQFSGTDTLHSVVVNSEQSNVSPQPSTHVYEVDEMVMFSASMQLEGNTRHTPTGYTYTIGDGSPVQGTGVSVELAVTGDIEFTWHWDTEHFLDVAVNGPGSLDRSSGWVAEGAGVTVQASAEANASFTGWSGQTDGVSLNGSTLSITSMDAPVGPVVANFTIDQHSLTVVSEYGSPVPEVGSHVYEYGTEVDVAVESISEGRTRRVVTGWSTTGADEAEGDETATRLTIEGDTTLTWNWETQVLLEVESGAEGQLLPLDSGKWHPLNSVVTIECVPGPYFTFAGWSGDLGEADASQSVLSLTMDQARSLVADIAPILAANGTPHWWLENQGIVEDGNYDAAELSDSDGNGLSAAEEFAAGIPVGGGALTTLEIPDPAAPMVEVSWQSQLGRHYTLESSDDLDRYDVVETTYGTGSRIEVPVPGPGSGVDRAFFRVAAGLAPGMEDAVTSPGTAQFNFAREMVRIPAGSFVMGEEDEGIDLVRPEHTVNLDAYHMDKFEVTRGDWKTVARWAVNHGYDLPTTLKVYDHVPDDSHPAVPITWYEAVKWCNARSEMEGLTPSYYTDREATTVYRSGEIDLTPANVNWSGNGYRLPTEAEWEYAARGGRVNEDYPWGDETAVSRANTWQHLESLNAHIGGYPFTRPVGHFDGSQPVADGYTAEDMANGYGLYDMGANVFEWVFDLAGDYSALEEFGPTGPYTNESRNRILRSGSWFNNSADARVFFRTGFPPESDDPYGVNGFRCVRPVHPDEPQVSGEHVYEFKNIGDFGTALAEDGWLGDDLEGWVVQSFDGLNYARNTNDGDDAIYRSNDGGFSYEIPGNAKFVSLQTTVRHSNNDWEVGLASGSNLLLGVGFERDGLLYLSDGVTTVEQSEGTSTSDTRRTFRVDVDLAAGTATLVEIAEEGETVLIDGVSLSSASSAALQGADGLFIRTASRYVGPGSIQIRWGLNPTAQ
ncbi:MAG: SUMF1/EgtB/PvdO family nonheme iron enzyme [Verrucomicrobiales bacterium]